MLAAAPAGFECTLGGCPREFVEIDRAEFPPAAGNARL